MDGRDAEAAALRGDARWGQGGTHQDPELAGCEEIAGSRSGDTFLACVRQLGVADQRGFCGNNWPESGDAERCARVPTPDTCALLNE